MTLELCIPCLLGLEGPIADELRRLGMELKDATLQMLGQAHQVKVTKENTTIVDGAGSKADIKARVAQIHTQIDNTTSDYDKEKLQERLAKLSGGVAVIKVGAATETEMKEKKLRIEDALNATRAAVEEGIVAGGGSAYVTAAKAVDELVATLAGDEKTGASIVAKALRAPTMNRKSLRPSEPGVRAYLLFLILFAAASLIVGQYLLAAAEGGIIAALAVYAIVTGRNNRRELMEYIESITYDTETAKNNTLQNFPLPIAVFRLDDTSIVWANQQFFDVCGITGTRYGSKLLSYVPDFSGKWLMEGKTQYPALLEIGGRKYQVNGNLVRSGGDEKDAAFMCLLHWLWTCREELGVAVCAAHYDHQLRGLESARDRTFVRDWCAENGIPLEIGFGEVRGYAEKNGLGLEEAARETRYAFFASAADKLGCDRIATAHNADDNAETVLLNLTRGAGGAGLAGIPPVRGRLVRPLLGTTRDDILRYLEENHVDGSTDPRRDIETVDLELIFSDLEMVERRVDKALKAAKGGDKKTLREADLFKALQEHLNAGKSARTFECGEDEMELLRTCDLLTLKPVIYAANMDEAGVAACADNPYYKAVEDIAAGEGAQVLPICARTEEELGALEPEERQLFLEELGLHESGLDRMKKSAI